MIHYHRSWRATGTAMIVVGVVTLGNLLVSAKQYLLDKDYLTMIILSALGLLMIGGGIGIKRWARKNGKE